jgi:hypothetical protein
MKVVFCRYMALLVVSVVCYLASFTFSGLLFHWFTPSSADCQLNTFFIIFTLIIAVSFAVISLHPQVNRHIFQIWCSVPGCLLQMWRTYRVQFRSCPSVFMNYLTLFSGIHLEPFFVKQLIQTWFRFQLLWQCSFTYTSVVPSGLLQQPFQTTNGMGKCGTGEWEPFACSSYSTLLYLLVLQCSVKWASWISVQWPPQTHRGCVNRHTSVGHGHNPPFCCLLCCPCRIFCYFPLPTIFS